MNEESDTNASPDRDVETFYRRSFPRLVRECKSWGLNGSAEDVAQETLLRAVRVHEESGGFVPWAWLRTAARNIMIDKFRREGRQIPVALADIPEQAAAAPDLEEGLAVSEALLELPDHHRIALKLQYFEDQSVAESAAKLRMAPTAFKQLVYRARQSFSAAYAKHQVGWGLIGAPLAWLRRLAEKAADRSRRRFPRGDAAIAFSAGGHQIATGVVALIVAAGGVAAPSGLLERPDSPRVAHAAAAAAGHRIEDAGRDSARRPPADRGSDGEGSSTSATERTADPEKLVRDLVDPNRNVSEPEDAQLTSIVFSPRYSRDRTVMASGVTHCPGTCTNVLFVSRDGGASWTRPAGEGFFGHQLLLPPGYGVTDDRIFAVADTGLQVSEDGGETFRAAVAAGVGRAVGSAAISPAFNDGDPTILLGSQTLLRYRDDLKAVEPVPSTAVRGPLNPAYPPDYLSNGRLLMGGADTDLITRQPIGILYRCDDAICSTTPVSTDGQSPHLRLTPEYAASGLIHAFTDWGIYLSADGGDSFRTMAVPWDSNVPVADLAVEDRGKRLYAALIAIGTVAPSEDGLYLSRDRGRTWRQLGGGLFAAGATVVVSNGDRVVAALPEGGVACSADGGESWSRRCRGQTDRGR